MIENAKKLLKAFRNDMEYDPKTGVFMWRPHKRGVKKRAAGYRHTRGYMHVKFQRKEYKLHRVAWLFVYGEWPEGEIDHINGNKSDNRIENLRSVSHAQNMKNIPMYKNNSSGMRGVDWYDKKWRARIRVNGKLIYLGSFGCKIDAYAARLRAENKYGFHKNHGRIVG